MAAALAEWKTDRYLPETAMSQNNIFKFFIAFLLVGLVIVGVVLLRSCHSVEDPQHSGEDEVTHVVEAARLPMLMRIS